MSKKHKQPPPRYGKKPPQPKPVVPDRAAGPPTVPATAPARSADAGLALSAAGEAEMTVPARPDPSPVVTLLPMGPLICRSGRPFDDQTRADPARIPPPSTVAGCLRTAWARETGCPFTATAELMALGIAGPLLARPGRDPGFQLLAPRPADALYFKVSGERRCIRAVPARFPKGCDADLPDGLLPVQLAEPPDGKEIKGPAWWRWDDLCAFREGEPIGFRQLQERGWSPPAGDRRTHVAIEPSTYAAKTGQLFQTEGLDLSPPEGLKDDPESDLRLLVRCDRPLGAAMAHLGGERRLAHIEPREACAWPEPPEGWIDAIKTLGGVSLTLLTPGLFSQGYRPGWLSEGGNAANPAGWVGAPPDRPHLKLALRAVALGRWQPHSGWDLAAQQPRPGRKLVPAGAVYWLAIVGEASDADLAALWLASICDHPQDRRDGFGLALPAPWQPPAGTPESDTPK